MPWRRTLFAAALIVLFLSPRAHAYIDPGTGSMLVQIFIGSIIGGAFWFRDRLKQAAKRIFSLFTKNK
jgi:hypothetical protein